MAIYYKGLKTIEDYERMLQAHIQMKVEDFGELINDLKEDVTYKQRQFHFMAGKEGFDIKTAAGIKHLLIQYLGKNVKYLTKKKQVLNTFAEAMEHVSIPRHMNVKKAPESLLDDLCTNMVLDICKLEKFSEFEKDLLSECVELKRLEVLKKLYE